MRIKLFLMFLAVWVSTAGCGNGGNNAQNKNSADGSRDGGQSASPNVNVYDPGKGSSDPNISTVVADNLNGNVSEHAVTTASPSQRGNYHNKNLPNTEGVRGGFGPPTETITRPHPNGTPRP